MGISRPLGGPGFTTLLLVVLLLQGDLSAQKVGETVKNKEIGVSFRVPKGWVSIPVDPLDSLTLHKYQASRADQAKKTAGVSMTASLELFFFRISGAGTGDGGKSADSLKDRKFRFIKS